MKSHHKYILLLVIAVIWLFPLDPNIILNKNLGTLKHFYLWFGFVFFLLLVIDGKTLKEKWKNMVKEIRDGLK